MDLIKQTGERRPRLPQGMSRYAGVVIGLIVVCAVLSVTQSQFLTGGNWSNILRSQSVLFTLAIGMTLVILAGGLDLSIAAIATAALMFMGIAVEHGASPALAIVVAVGSGTGMGLINGLLVGIGGMPFFVVTLGTLSIYSSLALLLTSGQTISLFTFSNFDAVSEIANGSVGPVPSVLPLLLVLYMITGFVLHRTRAGRSIYAYGSNPEAAHLTGINTKGVQVLVYASSGLFAGIGAVLLGGRLTAAGPQVDPNLLLATIAAVLIGGTAFSGGEGGLVGTIVGGLFLGVVQNGLGLANVSTFWQGAVSGTILIVAVAVGMLRHRPLRLGHIRRRRGRRRAAVQPAGQGG